MKTTLISALVAVAAISGCSKGTDSADTAGESLNNVVESAKETTQEAANATQKAVESTVEGSKDIANKATEATQEATSNTIESAKNKISEIKDGAQYNASEAEAKDALEDKAETMKDQKMDEVKSDMTDKVMK